MAEIECPYCEEDTGLVVGWFGGRPCGPNELSWGDTCKCPHCGGAIETEWETGSFYTDGDGDEDYYDGYGMIHKAPDPDDFSDLDGGAMRWRCTYKGAENSISAACVAADEKIIWPSTGCRAMVRVLYHYWIEDGPCGEVIDQEYFLLGPLGDKGDTYVGEELEILLSDDAYMHQLVTGEKGGVAKEEGFMEIGGVLTLRFPPATPNPSAWSGWNEDDTEVDIETLWRVALPVSELDIHLPPQKEDDGC